MTTIVQDRTSPTSPESVTAPPARQGAGEAEVTAKVSAEAPAAPWSAGSAGAGQVSRLPATALTASALQSAKRVGALTSFDDDAHPVYEAGRPAGQGGAAPIQPAPRAGRRGRPRASASRVLASGGELSADDLALLRAWIQGVPASRGGRYLSRDAAAGGREAREYLKDLLARVAAAAAQLADASEREQARRLLAEPAAAAASTSMASTGARPPAPASVPGNRRSVPSLEEFAARFDADMYSEAELVELYQEEFGAGQADALGEPPVPAHESALHAGPASVAERLAILERLAPRLGGRPTGGALLAAWFEPQLAGLLSRSLDAPTLGALAERIAARGRWWWRAVPGLGKVRAQQVAQWLAGHANEIGVALPARVLGGPASVTTLHPGRHVAHSAFVAPVPSRLALAPLARLAWPAHLKGEQGVFRAAGPNTLGAADDAQALAAWVRIHLAGKAEATRRVYLRALERLVLWALCERQVALSSLTSTDFAAFRDFLAAPPAHWCASDRVVKQSAAWRPLRGALSRGAVAQVLGVVQLMWRDWLRSGYLAADAAALVPARAHLGAPPPATGPGPSPAPPALDTQADRGALAGLDVTRAFCEAQLQLLRAELEAMPEGPAQRRLRALLLLFLETGLRRAEAERLTFGAIEPLGAGGVAASGEGAFQLRVLGKRGKLRLVPLKKDVLEALEAHRHDRLELARAGILPSALLTLRQQDTPLLGILRKVREGGFGGRSDAAAAAARRSNPNGALAGASLHGLLKAFFARAAARAAEGPEPAAFERASAHWLRHTFAHRVLAAGGEQALAAAQALLGHASIATTGEYLRADARERFAALARVTSVL